MKKTLYLVALFFLGIFWLTGTNTTFAQLPAYNCDIRNEAFVASNVFEFDLYITRSGSTELELAGINTGILLNTGFVNGGIITPSLVGSSELNTDQVPTNIAYDATYKCVKIAPRKPPRDYGTGITSGTIIDNVTGTKVCRVRLTNSVDFGTDPLNYSWSMNVWPYHTVVGAFVAGGTHLVSTAITDAASHSESDNLTLYLEGLYSSGVGNLKAQDGSGAHFGGPVADEITVKLANASAPYSDLFTASNVLLYQNGKCSFSVPASMTGSYYLVVKHRNSIETWSAAPVSFASGTVNYDFSQTNQAYGNNERLIGSTYVIWGGDATQDGIVDGADMSSIFNASQPPALSGYNPEDVNGDGIVDGADMSLIFNNSMPPVVSVVKP